MEKNIEVYIRPRQCGKTTEVIKRCKQSMSNSLIVCNNNSSLNHIRRLDKRLFLVRAELIQPRHLVGIKHIYLDDYCFYAEKTKKDIYDMLENRNINIYVYSTADKKYNIDKIKYYDFLKFPIKKYRFGYREAFVAESLLKYNITDNIYTTQILNEFLI